MWSEGRAHLCQQVRMPFHQFQKFNQRSWWLCLASLIAGKGNFANPDNFRKSCLCQFKIFTDPPNVGAHITFYCSNNRRLCFSITTITLFIPNPFATRRTEISFHHVQCQRLPTAGKSLILNFGYHFQIATSWTFHSSTSLCLELDNRRSAISIGGNFDVYFGSIFSHAVVNILPVFMIAWTVIDL